LIAYRGDSASQSARRILVERLQWLRLALTREVAEAVRPGFAPLPDVGVESIGETEQPSMLGTIVPLVLVLMTITGAVYPAIDLTAGERERGTMESLMASPVPRWSLLVGKYAAVVTVALLTAIANLLAMFITLWASGLLPLVTGDRSAFPWLELLQILGLLLLFSGFFAAVLLSLTSFAKSFKEAQSYLIPVMLLSLAPAMLSLMPGTALAGPLAIAPLINIVLLARDVLSGSVQPVGAVAAIISTAAYAAAALAVAARLFGSDAVNRTSDDSIGSLFHRPERPRPVPTPQAAALMLALLVPVYFIVSNGLMRFLDANRETISISNQLLLNAAALVAAFGLVPLLAAHFGRNVFRTTYRLRLPSAASFLGAVLVGGGAWALAHEAFLLAEAVGIGGLSEERIRQTLKTVEGWKQVSPVLLVGTLAVAPAVVEELCFRGYLFSALLKVLSPARTVLVTAVLFGLFHVLTGNALLIERLVPSTLLGLILGWIAWRTGSVFPGMVMHLVHNGLLELVARYHDQLEFLPSDLDRQTHLPASWLLTATGVAVVGAAVIAVTTRKGGG
jgi:ABC-2 type transport system permease protein/sodium transport system permease protein